MDNVAQLIKLAKEKKDENAGKKAVGAAYVSAIASGAGQGRDSIAAKTLGYNKVYHGTPLSDNAKKIREKGLKKSKGGTGSSVIDDAQKTSGTSNNMKRSKGRVYFSKNKDVAKGYTRDGSPFHKGDAKNVVTARISHNQYSKKSGTDSLVKKLNNESNKSGKTIPKAQHKANAAKSKQSISPSKIEGGSKYKGRRQYATAKNMKKYLSSGSGRKRFASGVAQGAITAGSAVYSAKKGVEALKNKVRDRKKS